LRRNIVTKFTKIDNMKKIDITFKVIYESGKIVDRERYLPVEVSDEDYRKIVEGTSKGLDLGEIDGIEEAINNMKQRVIEIDCYYDLNGKLMNKPLKKPRRIADIEVRLPKRDAKRIMSMKDPLQELDRQAESMKIYRSDGSFVTIKYEFGQVIVEDSRNKGGRYMMNSDDFVRRILI